MAKRGGELGSAGSRTKRLVELRRDPRYERGELIQEAAALAINVGRPAFRDASMVQFSSVGHRRESYDEINQRYMTMLESSEATGWEAE